MKIPKQVTVPCPYCGDTTPRPTEKKVAGWGWLGLIGGLVLALFTPRFLAWMVVIIAILMPLFANKAIATCGQCGGEQKL